MKTQIRLTNKLRLMCGDIERKTLQSLSIASVDDNANKQLYIAINKLLKHLSDDPEREFLDHFIQVKYGDLFNEISNET